MSKQLYPNGIGVLRRCCRTYLLLTVMATAFVLNAHVCAQETSTVPTSSTGWTYFPSEPQAPEGAPNVLLVLTDDVGFSASSTFGGPIPTPTLDRLAANGLLYNSFHTTAMCSPTRAALLTGRNHHAVSAGSITNFAYDAPGYTSVIPKSAATMGRILRDNGFDTAWFGKNHNTPEWEVGPMGPFDRWPNGLGFDYFYGFNLAATDQVNPDLVENRNPVRRDPDDPNYFLDRDIADHMIHWLRLQHTLDADKPFFAYLAPGTMHIPQQAPADWIDRFKGKFDMGWDQLRLDTLRRQKEKGIIPEDARLAPRPPGVPEWASLTDDQRRLYNRLMEVAAGQLAYFDFQFGRVINELERTGELDNTLIIFIQGDNGAALQKMQGTANMYLGFQGSPETVPEMLKQLDELGGEMTSSEYPVGWAYATNTPFPWGKQVASHLGGLRAGLVVSWPNGIKADGGIRTQFSHVIDIAPTICEAVGVTPPPTVDGVTQQPFDGTSMVYTFANPDAAGRHTEQYFEMLGNRAYYRDGWIASTNPPEGPWNHHVRNPDDFSWSLYNLKEDFSQTRDISRQYPQRLKELQTAFENAAERNHVYPLNSNLSKLNSRDMRPQAIHGEGKHVFFPGDTRYALYAWPKLTPEWEARAEVELKSERDNGPIFNKGDRFCGYALSLDNGRPVFTYNPTGRSKERTIVTAPEPLTAGAHTVTVGFRENDNQLVLRMAIDGKEVDEAPVDRLIELWFGTAYVGRPGLDDRIGPRRCDCVIEKVIISNNKGSEAM